MVAPDFFEIGGFFSAVKSVFVPSQIINRLKILSHMTDLQRVEMSLPAHIMLAVLVSGANCADPGPMPLNNGDPYYLAQLNNWAKASRKHDQRLHDDPAFARSYERFIQTKNWLVDACDEALRGVYDDRKRKSLLRRIERAHIETVKPYLKGDDPDPRKVGIIAYYLLQHLVDTEILIVPAESSFGKALAYLLPALSPTDDASESELQDYEALNQSAQKQVRKILINLQNEGYYKDIPLPDYH